MDSQDAPARGRSARHHRGSPRSGRAEPLEPFVTASQRSGPAPTPLWTPAPERVARANLTRFMAQVRQPDYADLYRWSVDYPARFWPELWRFGGVIADERAGRDPWDAVLVGGDRMAPPDSELGPKWFTGATLNFAENLLRHRDNRRAIVFWNELGRRRELTFGEMAGEVGHIASALRSAGVRAGDRVAGFMPNIPETVIAMLAAASLGAIWSSCSPDFG